MDQFSLIPEHMVKLYSISGLTRGPHTIEIEVTKTRNPLSRGIRVAIDAFDVLAAIPEEVGAQ